jgi:prepilin-type N-terminal cleavage/methylation domain-containing protein
MVDPTSRETGDDAGFSLLEVILAMALFAGFVAALLSLTLSAQALGVSNRNRVAAISLAERELEIVKATFYTPGAPQAVVDAGAVTNANPLSGGTVGDPLVVDGTSYTVVRTAAWKPSLGSSSPCDGGSVTGHPPVAVTVTVTWPNMGTVRPVTVSAVLSPSKDDGAATTSAYAAVKVIDAAGDPNPGRGVRVTGSNGDVHTGSTDSAGCAVLQLFPGASGATYVAQLTDTDRIDIVGGIPDPTRSLGMVSIGDMNTAAGSTPFTYDSPGTIVLKVVNADGSVPSDATVAAQGLSADLRLLGVGPISWTDQTIALTQATTTVPTALWPTDYAVDFDPTGSSPSTVLVPLTPGGTRTVTLTLPAAQVTVADEPPALTAVIAVPAGGTCDATSARFSPSTFALSAGTWDFYAEGTGYTCSAGPSGVVVPTGGTQTVTWAATTLQVDNASDPRTLRAVQVSGLTVPTCPSATDQAAAVTLTSALSGPQDLPPGSWYLYWAQGATCEEPIGYVSVPYGVATVYTMGG